MVDAARSNCADSIDWALELERVDLPFASTLSMGQLDRDLHRMWEQLWVVTDAAGNFLSKLPATHPSSSLLYQRVATQAVTLQELVAVRLVEAAAAHRALAPDVLSTLEWFGEDCSAGDRTDYRPASMCCNTDTVPTAARLQLSIGVGALPSQFIADIHRFAKMWRGACGQ